MGQDRKQKINRFILPSTLYKTLYLVGFKALFLFVFFSFFFECVCVCVSENTMPDNWKESFSNLVH